MRRYAELTTTALRLTATNRHTIHKSFCVSCAFLWLITLNLLAPSTLRAQSREAWVSSGITGFGFPYSHTNRDLGSTDPSGNRNDVQIDSGWRIGFRFAFNTSGSFGHEFEYNHTRPKLIDNTGNILGVVGRDDMQIHQAGYNFLYYFSPRESNIRPMATIGVHVNGFVMPASSSIHDNDTEWGFNYGLGMKWRLTPLLAVRWDVRAYESGKPNWGGSLFNGGGGLQHQIEASAGVGIYF